MRDERVNAGNRMGAACNQGMNGENARSSALILHLLTLNVWRNGKKENKKKTQISHWTVFNRFLLTVRAREQKQKLAGINYVLF